VGMTDRNRRREGRTNVEHYLFVVGSAILGITVLVHLTIACYKFIKRELK